MVLDPGGVMRLTDAEFLRNVAEAGGGFSVQGLTANISLRDCRFAANNATRQVRLPVVGFSDRLWCGVGGALNVAERCPACACSSKSSRVQWRNLVIRLCGKLV